MDVLGPVKSLLGFVPFYVALQRGVGADRLRERCLREAGLGGGEFVIDIGCGPAYYLERVFAQAPAIRYAGFDTSARYIAYAKRRFAARFGPRAEFHCEQFTPQRAATLPPADVVLLLGLLHHLDDAASRDLLALAASCLAPGGRVVTVDTCFTPGQSAVSRWMSRNDRGEHVRAPAAFAALAEEAFAEVRGEILGDVTRVPSSHWMMRLAKPRAIRRPGPAGPRPGGTSRPGAPADLHSA